MKLDKRRKYFMILDCETATVPFASEYGESKGAIALQKPVIYDIGWQIVDKKGNVYKRVSSLVAETFTKPEVFDTAYYADKRPIYLDLLAHGEIELRTWNDITAELESDLAVCSMVGAYNSGFDFKKAIPFTERYMKAILSPDYKEWEKKQRYSCDVIAGRSEKKPYKSNYDNMNFIFRGKKYPLFDIWQLACDYILNCEEYKSFCIKNKLYNTYFKTSAETTFQYLLKDMDFAEQHRAIDDVEIETAIFAESVKRNKNKIDEGITAFPFRKLGTVKKFLRGD